MSWTFIDHSVSISVGNSIQVKDMNKYEIDKPQIGKSLMWSVCNAFCKDFYQEEKL